MSIKLKKIQRANPSTPEQPRKWYLTQNSTGRADINVVAEHIAQRTSLARGDILNVLSTLVEVMPTIFQSGQSVQLGYLGTFGVSVSSAGKDTPEVLPVRDVKQKRVVYTPSTELKSKISALSCEVIG